LPLLGFVLWYTRRRNRRDKEDPTPTSQSDSAATTEFSKIPQISNAALECNRAYEESLKSPRNDPTSDIVNWKEMDKRNAVQPKQIVIRNYYFDFSNANTLESHVTNFIQGINKVQMALLIDWPEDKKIIEDTINDTIAVVTSLQGHQSSIGIIVDYAESIQKTIPAYLTNAKRTRRLSSDYVNTLKTTISKEENIHDRALSQKVKLFELHNVANSVHKSNITNIVEEIKSIIVFTRQKLCLDQQKKFVFGVLQKEHLNVQFIP